MMIDSSIYGTPTDIDIKSRPFHVGRHEVPIATMKFIRYNVQRLKLGNELEFQKQILRWLDIDPEKCGFQGGDSKPMTIQEFAQRGGPRGDQSIPLKPRNNKRRRYNEPAKNWRYEFPQVRGRDFLRYQPPPDYSPSPSRPFPSPGKYRDAGTQVKMEEKHVVEQTARPVVGIPQEKYNADVMALEDEIKALRMNDDHLFQCGVKWKKERDELREEIEKFQRGALAG